MKAAGGGALEAAGERGLVKAITDVFQVFCDNKKPAAKYKVQGGGAVHE